MAMVKIRKKKTTVKIRFQKGADTTLICGLEHDGYEGFEYTYWDEAKNQIKSISCYKMIPDRYQAAKFFNKLLLKILNDDKMDWETKYDKIFDYGEPKEYRNSGVKIRTQSLCDAICDATIFTPKEFAYDTTENVIKDYIKEFEEYIEKIKP